MPILRLNGPQVIEFRDLIMAAFSRADLTVLLLRMNERIDDYASPADPYPTVVLQVLVNSNQALWWREFLRQARNMRPTDPDLQAFAEKVQQTTVAVDVTGGMRKSVIGPQLEQKIKDSQSTFDVLPWRMHFGEIESRVCRVEYPAKTARGTGFLVGPNLVLTNYHVMRCVKTGDVKPDSVALRFDYKVTADGISVFAGKTYDLASSWLVDDSPYSARDLESAPESDPAADELDYALLRVNGQPGKDPVGGDTNDPNPVPRGWIKPSREPYDFKQSKALYIVQHPDGAPMQVAIDSEAILGVNGAGNRVRYTTTTERGSSGSPCFGPDWQWIALHQSGDPNWKEAGKPVYNQGIPAAAIVNLLRSRGHDLTAA